MAAYETDEARFEVPPGWADRSVTALEYSRPEGLLRVVVMREPRGKSELGALHKARLVDLRRRLAGFELVHEDEVLLAGRPAFDVAMRYRDEEAHLYQRTATMIVGAKLVSVGVVAPASLVAQADELFQRIRASLVIRAEAESA